MSAHNIATVTEKANKTLQATLSNLNKAILELSDLAADQENLIEQVQVLENRRDSLESEMNSALREHAATLKIRLLESSEQTLSELLAERGQTALSTEVLQSLKTAVAEAEAIKKNAVDAAVKQAEAAARSAAYVQSSQADAAHKVALAQLEAKAQTDAVLIDSLRQQVAKLEASIEADRAARIEIAKAESGRQGVVVNTSGK